MKTKAEQTKIKCVVWDLDNTLWKGILLENDNITLNCEIADIIKTFDNRGILNSIASRSDYESAKRKIIDFGLWDYFLYPEISWSDKSQSIKHIADNLNIDVDSFAFVDDQIFEREEVKSVFPDMHIFSPDELIDSYQNSAFIPRFITNESAHRRQYYQADIQRNKEQELFNGNNTEFLKTLDLNLTISNVTEHDLQRAEELTLRTHQLNTTGISYSYEELKKLMNSKYYNIHVFSLSDKYGAYGTIGLSLIEKMPGIWKIKLLLMSCRVISRNIGNTYISILAELSKKEKVTLQADFLHNEKNRQMYITYKFNGFQEINNKDNYELLELIDYNNINIPEYIRINNLMKV